MRRLIIILVLVLSSCSVEQRIHRWSYTADWYWKDGSRYQVYKTITGRRYIIVTDTTRFELERQYIKPDHEQRLD